MDFLRLPLVLCIFILNYLPSFLPSWITGADILIPQGMVAQCVITWGSWASLVGHRCPAAGTVDTSPNQYPPSLTNESYKLHIRNKSYWGPTGNVEIIYPLLLSRRSLFL